MSRLKVLPKPCDTCPYSKSTPPGVWHPEEYLKLKKFDDPLAHGIISATFLCHNGGTPGANDTLCRGWLSVHADSIPVRFLLSQGRVSPEDIPEELDPGLYASGAEACAAGLRGVKKPSRKAKKAMDKILTTRVKTGVGGPCSCPHEQGEHGDAGCTVRGCRCKATGASYLGR